MIGSSLSSSLGSLHFTLLLIPFIEFFWSVTHASCYFPNGTNVNALFVDDIYLPCDDGDEFSMCCALNRNIRDRCRKDGLCFSLFDRNIWRESCTDPTWKSPSCVKLCDSGVGQYIEGLDVDLADDHHTVTPCGDGSYCCGNGTRADACCEDKKGLFLLNGTAVSLKPATTLTLLGTLVIRTTPAASTSAKPSSLATSSTASSASSPLSSNSLGIAANTAQVSSSSAAALPTSTSTSAAKSSNKTGVIAGGSIGGVAALALIIGITLLLLRRRKKIRDVQDHHQPSMIKSKDDNLHEVSGDDGINELNGNLLSLPELQNSRPQYEMQ